MEGWEAAEVCEMMGGDRKPPKELRKYGNAARAAPYGSDFLTSSLLCFGRASGERRPPCDDCRNAAWNTNGGDACASRRRKTTGKRDWRSGVREPGGPARGVPQRNGRWRQAAIRGRFRGRQTAGTNPRCERPVRRGPR